MDGGWGGGVVNKSQERSSTLGALGVVLFVLLDYDYDDGGCHPEGPHCISILERWQQHQGGAFRDHQEEMNSGPQQRFLPRPPHTLHSAEHIVGGQEKLPDGLGPKCLFGQDCLLHDSFVLAFIDDSPVDLIISPQLFLTLD